MVKKKKKKSASLRNENADMEHSRGLTAAPWNLWIIKQIASSSLFKKKISLQMSHFVYFTN